MACGTEENRKLLSSKDWYFSELNRRLMREFYKKNSIPRNMAAEEMFKEFDRRYTFKQVEEPNSVEEDS